MWSILLSVLVNKRNTEDECLHILYIEYTKSSAITTTRTRQIKLLSCKL